MCLAHHLHATLILAGGTLCCAGCGRAASLRAYPSSEITAVELDHVYVFAPAQSTEAEVVSALAEAGLRVSDRRSEFPDGVSGRYVVFDNGYLEVLWYDGSANGDSSTRRTAAWERTGASPMGVGLRRVAETPEALPFPTRGHSAEWMEPGTEMRLLGTSADTLARSLFVVPRSMAYPDSTELAAWVSSLPPDKRERAVAERAPRWQW